MISCRSCDELQNNDPDGMILTCAATGHRCFIDDLPFTTMKNCPKMKKKSGKTHFSEITASPEKLAEWLLNGLQEINVYDQCFTVTVEHKFDVPYYDQKPTGKANVVAWLNSHVED